MDKIYVKLETKNTPKMIDGSLKKGRDYIVFVNEKFNVRDNLRELIDELNYQLKRDGMESLDYRNRDLERELMRLQVDKTVDVKIN